MRTKRYRTYHPCDLGGLTFLWGIGCYPRYKLRGSTVLASDYHRSVDTTQCHLYGQWRLDQIGGPVAVMHASV